MRTDMSKLIVAFCNFANASKNAWPHFYYFYCKITVLKRFSSFSDFRNHTQPSKYKVSGTKDAAALKVCIAAMLSLSIL